MYKNIVHLSGHGHFFFCSTQRALSIQSSLSNLSDGWKQAGQTKKMSAETHWKRQHGVAYLTLDNTALYISVLWGIACWGVLGEGSFVGVCIRGNEISGFRTRQDHSGTNFHPWSFMSKTRQLISEVEEVYYKTTIVSMLSISWRNIVTM